MVRSKTCIPIADIINCRYPYVGSAILRSASRLHADQGVNDTHARSRDFDLKSSIPIVRRTRFTLSANRDDFSWLEPTLRNHMVAHLSGVSRVNQDS